MRRQFVTHAGPFHADEIVAYCLRHAAKVYFEPELYHEEDRSSIRYERWKAHYEKKPVRARIRSLSTFPRLNFYDLVRTNSPQPGMGIMNEEHVDIVDIGGKFDPENGKFDHHHDRSLPAACVLYGDYLFGEESWYTYLRRDFLMPISDIDCGIVPDGGPLANINRLVKNFYNYGHVFEDEKHDWDALFQRAATAVWPLVEAAIVAAWRYDVTMQLVKNMPAENRESVADGRIVLFDSPELDVLQVWREADPKIEVFITPSSRGGYQALTRSTERFILPEHPKATFRHNSGFLVSFQFYEDALEYAHYITPLLPA